MALSVCVGGLSPSPQGKLHNLLTVDTSPGSQAETYASGFAGDMGAMKSRGATMHLLRCSPTMN